MACPTKLFPKITALLPSNNDQTLDARVSRLSRKSYRIVAPDTSVAVATARRETDSVGGDIRGNEFDAGRKQSRAHRLNVIISVFSEDRGASSLGGVELY